VLDKAVAGVVSAGASCDDVCSHDANNAANTNIMIENRANSFRINVTNPSCNRYTFVILAYFRFIQIVIMHLLYYSF
jgi:hypothetical protein